MRALLRPTLTIVFLALLLAFVFEQSQSINLERIQNAQHLLSKIEAQESYLERDMLKIRHGDIIHYDSLKYIHKTLLHLKDQLQPLIPEHNQAIFLQLQQSSQQQTFAIEQFMADQSVLSNSLHYLPKAIASSIEKSPQQSNDYMVLHRDILTYLRHPNVHLANDIQTASRHLDANKSLQRHINLIVSRHHNVSNAMDSFHQASLQPFIATLNLNLNKQLKSDINNLERYQLWLFILTIILIGYIGWVVWQQTNIANQLRIAIRKIKSQQSALDEHAIVAITDQRGDITYTNEKFCAISGYSQDELLGKNHRIINSSHHSKSFFEEMWRTIAQGQAWHGIICNQNKQGDLYWVDTTIIPFLNEAGKPYQYVSIRTDVTRLVEQEEEQKLHQKKLEHAQRLESLGVLAGGIAHDFNNLLTVIMGNAGLIGRSLQAEHPANDKLQRVITASEKAANLCKQMLAFSGKGHFIVEHCDLSTLVTEMADLLMVSIAKNVVIKYELDEKIPAIEADTAQIQQVIMNLITNANEAFEGGNGVITLSSGWLHADRTYLNTIVSEDDLAEGDYVYLEVSDNGCGMDQLTISKIFDPFFTTKFTGRGLGMSALLGIIRGHMGGIKISSELGHGSTFRVLFPVAENAAEMSLKDVECQQTTWQSGGGIALIVDDEEDIREMAGCMLRDMGFDILEAENGLEAVNLYPEHRQDIRFVLLDMSMPIMDGEETFHQLRKINPDVLVILSSGYNEQESTQRFKGKGLAGFVQKPYLPDTLQAMITDILQTK